MSLIHRPKKPVCEGEHKWLEARYGNKTCSVCGVSNYPAEGQLVTALMNAEKEHGPFGAARGMLSVIPGTGSGLSYNVLFNEDGKWQAADFGGACYASFHDLRSKEAAKKWLYIWDYPFLGPSSKPKDCIAKAWKACGEETGWASQWYEWMAMDSPWSHCFLTKHWLEAFEKGVMYSSDIESIHLLTAMCGIRYIGENPVMCHTWVEALKHLKDPMLALLAAHHGSFTGKSMKNSIMSSGHSMFYTSRFTPGTHMKNFLQGKLQPPTLEAQRGKMREKWSWWDCIQQFGPLQTEYDNRTGRYDEPERLKLPPDRGGQYERDIFGTEFWVPEENTVAKWMTAFEKEVRRWA